MSSPGQVLIDGEADRRLRRDGFVTFPLLAADRVEPLREQYGRLHGWTGEGFQSDLVVDDPVYRRATSDAIAAGLDDAVSAVFQGYRPFLRNFLCKFPGAESDLYIHRDWMYVDERVGHRTYVAWVALEDITGHNGQLRVLRGSHELDPMLRGTDLIAPWLSHTDTINERFLEVPVRAGDCVVFDNRVVHASFPNHTDRPRVVAAVGMRPADAPLVHFRRAGPDAANRYDVDEEFFLTETPQGLMAAPPDLPVAETAPVVVDDMSYGELMTRLDTGMLTKADRARSRWRRRRHQVRDGSRAAADHVRSLVDTARAALSRQDDSDGPDDSAASASPRPRRSLGSRFGIGGAGTERPPGTVEPGSWGTRFRRTLDDLPTSAAIGLLGVNEAAIGRFGPETEAVWDPTSFEWAGRIEAGWADIRAEVDALLAGPTEIPHIEDVTGGIPQGNVGPWRSFVLMHQGRWMDWNCDRCPATTELVRSIPGLTMAGFSVLEPGTHITEHRGPNKGALRYQLGVTVPGTYGDCRIRVADEILVWQEGEGVMFDFTFPHEAWNDSDSPRVLLMLEVITPLPWYLDGPNRLAQRAMGWFPTTRDMTKRLRELEPTLERDVAPG